ncbi:metal ABC transporter permease [Rhodobaculum claviforme]|uniref:ABC transporter n=1 Tax=Rhodobaculum claviforme TaxID=1549854 RepID=A0A934TJI9_9RHOB|nr:metal ABC transporter permease [Rhodobaculum claviforme]MBK5927320.1 ABC transporter [Rhodobaculum claviforme]
MSGLLPLLQSGIVQTVALGAAILGVVGGVLGVFAVLRRQSLMGDALSHAALPGVCLGFLVAGARDLGAILTGAFLSGALAALTVMLIVRRTRLKTDAALGIVLSVYFAVGVVLLTHAQATGGAAQAGLATFLFGQAAAILRGDLWIMGGVTALALTLVVGLWKEFKLVAFDPDFARALGLPVLALEAALTVMVAMAIVVGLQMVGVVLMVAMLIAPAAAARQWTRSLGGMVVLSAVFGAGAGVTGALISATGRGLPTGPVVVLVASAVVAVSLALAPGRGAVWQAVAARTQRRTLAARRVMMTIHDLGAAHGDPAYPAEGGMLDAFHGTATRPALRRLEARGLVRPVTHPPEDSPHWALTERGQAAARAVRDDAGAP